MDDQGFRRRDVMALGIVAFTVSACGSDSSPTTSTLPTAASPPPPTPTPTPTPVTLTVTNGIQAATQTSGATLDVFANADPTGQIFDKWTGATSVLQNPGERRSGVLAFAASSTIVATYKPLAQFTPQTAVLNGLPASNSAAVNAYWFFPRSLPRGVVFRFHGTGGNGGTQFTKVEELKFARDCVADGYAVVSLDSNDRVNKNWDGTVNPANPAANIDVANVQQLIAQLTTLGLMNAATPIFASGHSAGAGNALRTAFLLNWKASHQSCVPGPLAIAQATTVPGIWTMAQNDTREVATRNADALTASNALSMRPVPIATSYTVVAPSAVYPTRFTQIPGLSVADSTAIYNALKTAGALTTLDYQIADPNDLNLTPIVPAAYSAYTKDIQDQLFTAYAAHQFSSATSRRVLDFFAARL